MQRHLDYIDQKLAAHNKALAQADKDTKTEIKKEIAQRKVQRVKYEQIQKELKEDTSTENRNYLHQIQTAGTKLCVG